MRSNFGWLSTFFKVLGCSRYFRRVNPKQQTKRKMPKACLVIKKVEVTNKNNSKPPQFNGKAGDVYLMWSMKFKGDMVMKNLWEAFLPEFEDKLPPKEAGPFDDDKDHQKAVKMNQKAMMQLTLAFTNVGLFNKINCKQQKDKANWPTGKAHSVMTVLLNSLTA